MPRKRNSPEAIPIWRRHVDSDQGSDSSVGRELLLSWLRADGSIFYLSHLQRVAAYRGGESIGFVNLETGSFYDGVPDSIFHPQLLDQEVLQFVLAVINAACAEFGFIA